MLHVSSNGEIFERFTILKSMWLLSQCRTKLKALAKNCSKCFFVVNLIFICQNQINTMVMKKQLGSIQVQVPPNIVDDENNDVSVNEGDNVTLTCKATGKPVPRIVWRREDGQNLITNKHKWNTTNIISNSDNLQQNSVSSNEERVQGI
jgi:hypothetical protein